MSVAAAEGSSRCLVVYGHMSLIGAGQEGQELQGELIKGVRRAFGGINRMT